MPEIVETPINHPVAWRAGDFSSPDDIAIVLTPDQRRARRAWYDLTPVDEALPGGGRSRRIAYAVGLT